MRFRATSVTVALGRGAAPLDARPLWLRPIAIAGLSAAAGVALAYALRETAAPLLPHRVLVLCGLVAAPMPLVPLYLVGMPPGLALRRALGESSAQSLSWIRRGLVGAAFASLAAPAGVAAVALLDPGGATTRDHLLRAAMAVAIAGPGSLCLGAWSVAGALDSIGSGRADQVAAAAGGVYGPAWFAPLLYAPTLGYVGALLPVGTLSAFWGGLPTPPAASAVFPYALMILTTMALIAWRSLGTLDQHAHRAWLRVDEALATPFTLDHGRPEPPRWLVGRSPLAKLYGRAWIRRRPLPLLGPALVAGALVFALGAGAPAWAMAAVAGCLAAAALLRAAAFDPAVEAPAVDRLVGATAAQVVSARRRLQLGLAAAALPVALLFASRGAPVAGIGGAALGVVLGAAALLGLPAPVALTLHRLALLGALGVTLIGAR